MATTTAIRSASKRQGAKRPKPSCATCYFGVRMLCALDLNGPCTTFRPDSSVGLVPPEQPMLLIEAEGAGLAVS